MHRPGHLGTATGFLACYFPVHPFGFRLAIRSRDISSHLCPLRGRYSSAPHGAPTVKNSLAILVRVLEQAVRDGIIDRNPAKVTGWQREYQRAEDELDDPRSLALPNWAALTQLAPRWLSNQRTGSRAGVTL